MRVLTLFGNIANNLRSKFNLQGNIVADNFPTVIDNLKWSGSRAQFIWEKWSITSSSKGDTRYEDVYSEDSTAYPDNGEKDGYWYVKVVKPSSKSAVYTGSEITNGVLSHTHITKTGTDRGTEIGNYTALYTPANGYCLGGGTTAIANVTLTILPEYTELEYIESTGTLYIDTGVFPAAGYKIKTISMMSSSSGDDSTIIGCDGGFCTLNLMPSTPKIQFGYGRNWSNFTPSDSLVNRIDEYELNLINGAAYCTRNGTSILTSTGTLDTTQYSLGLFACHHADGGKDWGYISSMKLYSCIIMSNSTYIRNLIPVRRNSDNVICLYDTVTNTYFTNQGTGEFIAGPVVEGDYINGNT